MSKINGKAGDIFVCYAEDGGPTFNIVTNGDEDANGGVKDGIYEYRRLTYQDMMNGEILDEMSKKHTLNGWERYANKTPASPDNPPSSDPSKGPQKPPEPSKDPQKPPEPSKDPQKPPEPSKDPQKPPEPSKDPQKSSDPSKTPAPLPSVDPKNVSAKDIVSYYPQTGGGSNYTTGFTHLVNDIKVKAGIADTGQLYLKPGDVKKAMDMETDPNIHAIFEWVYNNFNRIDNVKETGNPFDLTGNDEDGLIGAGDLEKYFGRIK